MQDPFDPVDDPGVVELPPDVFGSDSEHAMEPHMDARRKKPLVTAGEVVPDLCCVDAQLDRTEPLAFIVSFSVRTCRERATEAPRRAENSPARDAERRERG